MPLGGGRRQSSAAAITLGHVERQAGRRYIVEEAQPPPRVGDPHGELSKVGRGDYPALIEPREMPAEKQRPPRFSVLRKCAFLAHAVPPRAVLCNNRPLSELSHLSYF
jgi:hypothetical protein